MRPLFPLFSRRHVSAGFLCLRRLLLERSTAYVTALLLLFVLFGGLSPAYAQPANNNFASAQTISGASGTLTGSNVNATAEAGENDHWGAPLASVWYQWTATASGTAVFTTIGTNFNTVLAVYRGSAVNGLTFVTNNDNYNGQETSRVSFNAVAGTTYKIAFDSREVAAGTGSFTLNWNFTVQGAPANDNFASAQTVSGTSGTVTGTNVGATKEAGEPSHWNGQEQFSVWYQWTASASGQATVTTTGSNFDSVMAVYTGSALNALTLLTNNDEYNDLSTSGVSFNAVSGTTYRIAVDSYNNGVSTQAGNVSLNWSLALPPNAPGVPGAPTFSNVASNTLTVTAPALPANATSLTLERKLNGQADTFYGNPVTGLLGNSNTNVTGLAASTAYVFRFVAVNATTSTSGVGAPVTTLAPPAPAAPGSPTFSNPQATGVVATAPALPANATSLTLERKLVGQADTSYGNPITGLLGNSNTTVTGLTASTAYTFRFQAVGAGGTTPGAGANFTTPAASGAPANDNFASAQTISGASGTLTGSNVNATAEAGENDHWGVALASVWYQWTATASGTAVFTTVGSNFDTALGVYTGSAVNATTFIANNDDYNGQITSRVSFSAVTGTTYKIAVDSRRVGDIGNLTLNWELPVAAGAPGAPTAPTFSNITQNGLTVTAPALPNNATSLTLERKLTSQADTSYGNPITGLSGGSNTAVTGLTANTSYTFRFVAVNATTSTIGSGAPVTTLAPPAPAAPGSPTFSNPQAISVVVAAPALPTNATSLTLERKLAGQADTSYGNPVTGLLGGSSTNVTGLTASTAYTFRFQAVGAGGTTPGAGANFTTPAASGAPANDNFASAQTISGASGTLTGSNANATAEAGENDHWGIAIASVWYQWTAPASGTAVLTTIGTNFNTVLGIYTGSAVNATTFIANNDNYNGQETSRVSFNAVAGTTYKIAFDSREVAAGTGSFTLNWELPVAAGAPGAPTAPTFSNITQSGLTVTAPALPNNATSLTLERKLTGQADTSYGNSVTGLSGGSNTAVTGLAANTSYTFRFVAVNATTSTNGAGAPVTTLPASTSPIPGAPTFLEVTTVVRYRDTIVGQVRDVYGRVVVRAPALPSGASRMILQFRTSAQTDASFTTARDAETQLLADNLAGNAVTPVEKLNFSTRYIFRYVAVTAAGVQTPGIAGEVVIPEAQMETKPDVPLFSNLTLTSVTVTAPALPEGAISLTLQVRPQSDTVFSNYATGLEGGSVTTVTYPTGQRNHYFRFVAVGTQGEISGDERAPTTIPEAPVLVANSITSQSASFNRPIQTGTTWIESRTYVYVYVLQRKKNGEPDSAYINWSTGAFNGDATLKASQLAPATSYTFRWSISGIGGIAYGASTNVTTLGGTQPAEVGPPTFTNIGPVSVTVIAPSTSLSTLRANRLKLQRLNGTAWSDVADNLAPGAQTPVTGLQPLTTYTFRYVAIANGSPETMTAGVSANVTTTGDTPEVPGVPTLVSTAATSITVRLPLIAAPLRTAALTLQYKLAEESDFIDWSPGRLAGDTVVTVTGLAPGRAYQMRVRAHAVAAGQNDTFGGILGTGTSAPLPSAPGAPQFVNILDPYTVQIKAPAALPANADYLTLQIMALNQGTVEWVDITDNGDNPLALSPNEVTEVSGLTPGLSYRFRYVAIGTGGLTPGPASADITMPLTSAAWTPSAVNTRAQGIQCRGIRIPNPVSGAITVARGASLRLSSYLATDWDQRTISAIGTPYTISYYLSDPCIYFWNARDGSANAVGSFQDGINRAQNAVWIAPTTPGTYNITLTVTDQEGANKATGEANSRDDANRGVGDTPLTFQLTITVP